MGFLKALQKVLRLDKGGLLFVGLPCSSYIFMSSSQHRRSPEHPGGNDNLEWVAQANTLCCRTMLLVAVAIARQCCWMIEQPSSSMAIYDPYVKFILSINDSDLNIFHQQAFWLWPRLSLFWHTSTVSMLSPRLVSASCASPGGWVSLVVYLRSALSQLVQCGAEVTV